MSKEAKVKVAILCRGYEFERWEAESIRKVIALPFVEISLLIREKEMESSKNGSRLFNYPWKRFLWNRFFNRYGNVANREVVSLKKELSHVPVIECTPVKKGKYSEYIQEDDLLAIKRTEPQVILRFGFNILRGGILEAAPWGVWSFHHADEEVIRGGPGGFWEYILGHNSSGVLLQRLTDRLDGGIILRKGKIPLLEHSFHENYNQLLECSITWMASCITDLHYSGRRTDELPVVKSNAPVYKYPGNLMMLRFLFVLLRNKIRFHWRQLFSFETWMVGVVEQSYPDVLLNGIRKPVKWIKAKRNDEYLADPFEWNGMILAEKYSYRERKGHLVLMDVNGEQSVFMDQKHHLSYPFTFSFNGNSHVLPEQWQSGELTLYTGDDQRVHRLMKGVQPVDPSVIFYKGQWWLFMHLADQGANFDLYVYWSDELTGPYHPHLLNPVKTDISNSRPAGTPVIIADRLYRPAQDSREGYGHAVVINEVTELSKTQFCEIPVRRLEPDQSWKYNKGLHTVSPWGENRTLIDAKNYMYTYAGFKAQLARKLKRFTGK